VGGSYGPDTPAADAASGASIEAASGSSAVEQPRAAPEHQQQAPAMGDSGSDMSATLPDALEAADDGSQSHEGVGRARSKL
jgi:hypothetical protein